MAAEKGIGDLPRERQSSQDQGLSTQGTQVMSWHLVKSSHMQGYGLEGLRQQ